MKEKAMALILPGLGYHSDKPLLYYAKKRFQKRGYKIREIVYRNLPEWSEDNLDILADIVTDQAEEQLRQIDAESYEGIVFISKSIGSVAACRMIEEWNKKWEHICFTPVNLTVPLLQPENTMVFSGTADPLINTAELKKVCKHREIPLYLIEDGNHSLETGDVLQDLRQMRRIMGIL